MMCEGRKWRFLAYDESDLQFTLQCYIRIRPVGIMSVTFEDGDVYEWTQVDLARWPLQLKDVTACLQGSAAFLHILLSPS